MQNCIKQFKYFLMFFVLMGLVACRTAQIYNVYDAQIAYNPKENITLDDIATAIREAAVRRHWIVREIEPGLIHATLNIRAHTAEVEIKYNKQSYSIIYKNSTNLRYRNGRIHPRYNTWIKNLRREIDYRLVQLYKRK